MGEGSAYENFDLEIKNKEELEEAKKAADVRSDEKQALKNETDFAVKENDEELFEKLAEREKALYDKDNENIGQESLDKTFKEKIEENFGKENDKEKAILLEQLKKIYNEIVALDKGNVKDEDNIIERALRILKEDEKYAQERRFKKGFWIEKDGTVNVSEKK